MMDDDYGFYTAAQREDMILADVKEVMQEDWGRYSPPANFRAAESCEHCVYLRRLKEYGIPAKACVRKDGPVFLDFHAVGCHTLDETDQRTCDKWENIFG